MSSARSPTEGNTRLTGRPFESNTSCEVSVLIRFLGIMIGSAATLGTMLLLLGTPEFHGDRPADARSSADQRDLAPAHSSMTDAPHPTMHDERSENVVTVTNIEEAPETELQSPPSQAVVSTAEAVEAPAPLTPEMPASEGSSTAASRSAGAAPLGGVEANWHSFWNPFRSEIAANGFATRLTRVTGIDYRVVRLEPGTYQVAFAYADDDERRSKISQIEQATGLELPEESL